MQKRESMQNKRIKKSIGEKLHLNEKKATQKKITHTQDKQKRENKNKKVYTNLLHSLLLL